MKCRHLPDIGLRRNGREHDRKHEELVACADFEEQPLERRTMIENVFQGCKERVERLTSVSIMSVTVELCTRIHKLASFLRNLPETLPLDPRVFVCFLS
jgi:hypothetical protein